MSLIILFGEGVFLLRWQGERGRKQGPNFSLLLIRESYVVYTTGIQEERAEHRGWSPERAADQLSGVTRPEDMSLSVGEERHSQHTASVSQLEWNNNTIRWVLSHVSVKISRNILVLEMFFIYMSDIDCCKYTQISLVLARPVDKARVCSCRRSSARRTRSTVRVIRSSLS